MSFCKWPEGCDHYVEGSTDYCGTHNALLRKQQKKLEKAVVKKVSHLERTAPVIAPSTEKTDEEVSAYLKRKKTWMAEEERICPVYPELPVKDIHHKKGREGYADAWVREHGITLLMDERFWLAVSRKGHVFIELHPTEARKRGWSLPRNEIVK